MEIRICNTESDRQAYLEYAAKYTPEGRCLGLIFLCLWLLLSGLFVAILVLHRWVYPLTGITAFVLAVALAVIISKGHPVYWFARRIFDRVQKLVQKPEDIGVFSLPKTIVISPDHFVCQNEKEDYSFAWNRMKKVARTDNYIFLLGGVSRVIFIIPEREFQTPDEFRHFGDLIIKYHKNSITNQ